MTELNKYKLITIIISGLGAVVGSIPSLLTFTLKTVSSGEKNLKDYTFSNLGAFLHNDLMVLSIVFALGCLISFIIPEKFKYWKLSCVLFLLLFIITFLMKTNLALEFWLPVNKSFVDIVRLIFEALTLIFGIVTAKLTFLNFKKDKI